MQNIETVRLPIMQSTHRSAAKHILATCISDQSVRRIVNPDLNFHLHKVILVQELCVNNWASRKALCEAILDKLNRIPLCAVMKHIFIAQNA